MKLPGLLLPNTNILPRDGICSIDETFLSPDESQYYFEQLLVQTEWQQYQIRIFGKLLDQPRLTAWYGSAAYTYSGLRFEPKEMGESLLNLLHKVEAYTGKTFNSVLLNHYRNENDSMGWHSDDEKELGINPFIASLSLGAERGFHLKHKTIKQHKLKIQLNHGSLLCMSGSMQHHWQHALPKISKACGPRINLTFREILPS